MFLKKIIILICFTVMKPSIMTYWNKLKPIKKTSLPPRHRLAAALHFLVVFLSMKRKNDSGSTASKCWKFGSFYFIWAGGAYRWGFYCEELGVVKSLKACCQSPDKWPGGSVWRSFPRCQWLVSFLSLSQLVSLTEAITSQRSAVVHNSDELLLWWRDFSSLFSLSNWGPTWFTSARRNHPHIVPLRNSIHVQISGLDGQFFFVFLFACFSWTI